MLFVCGSDFHFDKLGHLGIDLCFSLSDILDLLCLCHRTDSIESGLLPTLRFRDVEREVDGVVVLVNTILVCELFRAKTYVIFLERGQG